MKLTLGSLLGPLQTLLGANNELIATIERRSNGIYDVEIKGKGRNTWVSLKINFLHSNPGFGTRKLRGAILYRIAPLLLMISMHYRYSCRNSSTESPATEMRLRSKPCLIGFPL